MSDSGFQLSIRDALDAKKGPTTSMDIAESMNIGGRTKQDPATSSKYHPLAFRHNGHITITPDIFPLNSVVP
ncbi:hypothetical protein CXF83_00080 [Shewanella sp. Choline-02u-19]|nr:hypothetical protein CXF86_19925 [Shewanella sp. GutCb]PKH61686.1 hypothetical protein CXF84_01520 [Shewanella sp. Bg11-22]PKI30768.1 hypothetical protein CXF83_00080 [Shewanella sp. Choline-02u-19]